MVLMHANTCLCTKSKCRESVLIIVGDKELHPLFWAEKVRHSSSTHLSIHRQKETCIQSLCQLAEEYTLFVNHHQQQEGIACKYGDFCNSEVIGYKMLPLDDIFRYLVGIATHFPLFRPCDWSLPMQLLPAVYVQVNKYRVISRTYCGVYIPFLDHSGISGAYCQHT